MKKFLITILLGLSVTVAGAAERKRQLLIFVGEGNMYGARPEKRVLPVLKREKSLRGQDLKMVWNVQNYLPVSLLDTEWKLSEDKNKKAKKVKNAGREYRRLLDTVKRATRNKKYETVVLYWYQGQSDARNFHGAEYAKSVERVVKKLESDLGQGKINVVLTRLTDAKQEMKKNPDWKVVREAQDELIKDNKSWKLVDTDTFNGVPNNLKLTSKGYKDLSAAYAEHALKFISKNAKK